MKNHHSLALQFKILIDSIRWRLSLNQLSATKTTDLDENWVEFWNFHHYGWTIVQQCNGRKGDVLGFRLTERNQVTAINLAYSSTKEIGAYV